jgi:hypothetical protein
MREPSRRRPLPGTPSRTRPRRSRSSSSFIRPSTRRYSSTRRRLNAAEQPRGEEWQLVSVRVVPLNAIPATLQ